MDRHTMKKKNKQVGKDRLSALPDELIHHILWFSDAQIAVQTSVLSKRWKLVWTTLPFLSFKSIQNSSTFVADIKFINKFFACRNNDSDVFKSNLSSFHFAAPESSAFFIDGIIKIAISHNLQDLNVDSPDFILSRPASISSTTVSKLKLKLNFGEFFQDLNCRWRLPALTTLHLIRPDHSEPYKLPESYLVCLPSLQTLLLDGFELPNYISLPSLRTLILHIVKFPENVGEFSRVLQTLGNLRNLTLFFWTTTRADCILDCPELVNLEINYCTSTITSNIGKIIVMAPKICSFSSVGIFPIKFGVCDLENVNFQLGDSNDIKTTTPSKKMENFSRRVNAMFMGLPGAKILTLDLKTIEALSAVSDILDRSSPFFNLKYVKVPHGFKESSMSTYLKWYLLGQCPEATIVTTLPEKHKIRRTEAGSVPLAAPTKVLVGSQKLRKKVCIDTLGMGVQEEHVVQNSVVNTDRVTKIVVPVKRTGNDRVSSASGDSDFGLWRGHEVNSEFVCLLDIIMKKYPETFEHFTTSNKKLCTIKLNMLCSSVNVFTKISMAQVDSEMITEHRDVFTALQNLGFNVSWLVDRLNYVEQLRFSEPLLPELHEIDCHIDNAKNKLQDLQIRIDATKTELQDLHTVRTDKMQEIQKALGTMATNLLVGCIGDDLLSGP